MNNTDSTTRQAASKDQKIVLTGKQSRVVIRRYFSRRSQEMVTSIEVENRSVEQLSPCMDIEGAEDLLKILDVAIDEARRIDSIASASEMDIDRACQILREAGLDPVAVGERMAQVAADAIAKRIAAATAAAASNGDGEARDDN